MPMIKTYAGEAVQWECDELGHLNMRHYMGKVQQARQFFFLKLGLTQSFKIDAASTVRPKRFTIRYLKESRPGARIFIETGLLSLDENSAELVHIMTHMDGQVSAAITETVEHIYLRTGHAFGWPKRAIEHAQDYRVPRPDISLPRGLPPSNLAPLAPSKATLIAHKAVPIGRGVFQPAELDIFSAVTPKAILGRVTESIGNFYDLWPEIHEGLYSGGSLSGALLELSCMLHAPATAGDGVEIFSAVQGANPYTRQAAHHLVDPVSGESYASMTASGCLFDLTTRKLVKTPEARIKALQALAIEQLRA